MCVRHRLAGIVAVVVLAGAGCGHGQETHKGATPAASTPAAPAAVLTGTYRLDFDDAKRTANGAPYPTSNVTTWYAFRSSCESTTGCVATGTMLDTNNHQVARTPPYTTVMHFVGGRWQKVPARAPQPVQQCRGANGTVGAGEETTMVTDSWEPQPDGTLRGLKSETILTNECVFQGMVLQTPVVATRVGDVPPGVTVADPATVPGAPATSSPAPAAAGPTLNGAYRVDLDYAHQTVNGVQVSNPGPNQTIWWAFRSLCTSSGCVATGVLLINTNHQEAGGVAQVLHFTDGHWQGTPRLANAPCPPWSGHTGTHTGSFTWSWDPQPDGTLRGFETATALTNECGNQGTVYQSPMVVTRVGDVPPAVVLADPTLFF
jgi:hypothetical protein